MKFKPALTLIELILVIGLIVILAVPGVLSLPGIKKRQTLNFSGENFANSLRTARMYSKSEKDDKIWGIRFQTNNSYQLVVGPSESLSVVRVFTMDYPVEFTSSFDEIWFFRVTGEVDVEREIILKVDDNLTGKVSISKLGVIKYENL